MAQYFREFRDLTSDHENFPHVNLVLLWAWLRSMCTCASQARSCVRDTCRIAANNVQTLYAYFQKMNKSCLPNPQGPLSKQHTSSCIESANNHVEEMAKQTTAEGAKDRKRGPYKSCLVSFSSYLIPALY